MEHRCVGARKYDLARSFTVLVVAIILAVICACKVEEKEMVTGNRDNDPIIIEILPKAKGADQMVMSPNGRWLVLSYMIHDQLPLLVRLDRQEQAKLTVERGILGGPPADDGTLYYVEQESADRARLLITPASDRRSFLRRWGDDRRLIELHGAYGVHNVDAEHVILFGGGDSYDEIVVATETGEILARKNFSEVGSIVNRAFDNRHIYLLLDQSQRAGGPRVQDRLSIIALDVTTLEESWRQDHVAPAIIFSRPELQLFDRGTRLLLTSASSEKLATFSSATGAPGAVFDSPAGHGLLYVIPTAQPAKAVLVIWRSTVHGARGWKLLQVSKAGVEVVADRADDFPAASGVWDGSRALIAAYGSVTPGEPEDWDPVVRGYWDLRPKPVP
jgi:hypothetical protein